MIGTIRAELKDTIRRVTELEKREQKLDERFIPRGEILVRLEAINAAAERNQQMLTKIYKNQIRESRKAANAGSE